jgi:effector-binding domain-containing protein
VVDVELVELESQPVAVVRAHVSVDGIPGFLGEAYGEVMRVLNAQGLQPTGPPFGRYERKEGGFSVVAGFPTRTPITAVGHVEADSLPGGPAASLLYRGDYAGIAAAYEAALNWLSDHGYQEVGRPWESYLDGPEVAEPRTILRIPCAPRSGGPKGAATADAG